MSKIINPKLERYHKYAEEVKDCLFHNKCCKAYICFKPKRCCSTWTDDDVPECIINRITTIFEKDYSKELFIDFINELCK